MERDGIEDLIPLDHGLPLGAIWLLPSTFFALLALAMAAEPMAETLWLPVRNMDVCV